MLKGRRPASGLISAYFGITKGTLTGMIVRKDAFMILGVFASIGVQQATTTVKNIEGGRNSTVKRAIG